MLLWKFFETFGRKSAECIYLHECCDGSRANEIRFSEKLLDDL